MTPQDFIAKWRSVEGSVTCAPSGAISQARDASAKAMVKFEVPKPIPQ